MRPPHFRFQHWIMLMTTALVVTLSATYLFTVFGKFTAMSERDAQARFALISQRAAAEIANLIANASRLVQTQRALSPTPLFSDATPEQHPQTRLLFSALAADQHVYGIFYGTTDNAFVQAIALRDDQRLSSALKAPTGTHYALRRIGSSQYGHGRQEEWRFIDAGGHLLATEHRPSTYAPSTRPWFRQALERPGTAMTSPYLFASTGELGITLSTALAEPGKIIATDIKLSTLENFLGQLTLTPQAAILMLDSDDRIIAFQHRGEHYAGLNFAPLQSLRTLQHPLTSALAALDGKLAGTSLQQLAVGPGRYEEFVIATQHVEPIPGTRFKVLALAPMSDFTGPIEAARIDVMLVSLLLLALLLPLSMFGSRRLVSALGQMARNSESIKRLEFEDTQPATPHTFIYEINALGEAQEVMHRSIKERTQELKLSQQKLKLLVDNGLLMSRETEMDKLLREILEGGTLLTHCQAGSLLLPTDHDTLCFAIRTNREPLPETEIPLYETGTTTPKAGYISVHSYLNNQTVNIDDIYQETAFDLSGTRAFSESSELSVKSLLTVPLSPRSGEVIGVLQLINAQNRQSGEIIPFDAESIRFVEALAAQAAVALDNRNLFAAQNRLMDSMIRIIAGAIDAKSPYTGGHCERVPELAQMLAEEATASSSGSLANFAFTTEDEWREFRIGAWLHDCGKVTTPEYVVDKATKLETIHNRIHEIRTRFEVLLRDARIRQLQEEASGVPSFVAAAHFEAEKAGLESDFAFIAECNLGSEFMAPEKIRRLREIGGRVWLRHFDDRLGLSQQEGLRRGEQAMPLPASEQLLADQPWHILPRTDWRPFDDKYGFQIEVPPHLYHFGELHNLSISRGTLTAEERFKINEHIIQTIVMLENLPFPKHLRRVPEYAGTHHETLNGNGYPRHLNAEQLSIPARIMAIADIFEALTASDRPYKKAKTLSEAIHILYGFKKDQHIDSELFDLFLTSGIYLRYAERFLRPEQIDPVDISIYLEPYPQNPKPSPGSRIPMLDSLRATFAGAAA
ncbi:HD domain-containing phosphohydrolase [Dechloromonas sp. ZY10]|uniref:HD domain-containing phosphohydrolase n=1 Tax=Dechloromonas aquae TaxID=2664436 RepID=UPI003526D1A2